MKSNTTQKKILFFMTSLQMGGGERVSIDLMNSLALSGHSVYLVLMRNEGIYKNSLSPQVIIHDLNTNKISVAFMYFLRLVFILRPQSIFSSSVHLNPLVVIASILRFKKTKAIIRVGSPLSLLFKRYTSFKDKSILSFLTKITYPKADKIICVSRGIMHDTKTFLRSSGVRIQVIYSPKDYVSIQKKGQEFVPSVFQKYPRSTHLLFVGRLVEQKDPETLIRAMGFLKGKNFHLTIVGGGDKEENLKVLADSLGVSEDVSFEGPQNNPYVYMNNADIFVLSSLWEGMPNVLLESRVFNLKIVAVDCFPGSCREFVAPETDISKQLENIIEETNSGFLVPAQKPELFAEAIEKVREKELISSPIAISQNISTIEEYQQVFES